MFRYLYLPPRWPSGWDVRLESRRFRVQFPLAVWCFFPVRHTSDLKIGTPVATLPGACRFRVSAGTGWPSVSILWLGEVDRLICNFCLSVAACQIIWADPSPRYTSMLLPTNVSVLRKFLKPLSTCEPSTSRPVVRSALHNSFSYSVGHGQWVYEGVWGEYPGLGYVCMCFELACKVSAYCQRFSRTGFWCLLWNKPCWNVLLLFGLVILKGTSREQSVLGFVQAYTQNTL